MDEGTHEVTPIIGVRIGVDQVVSKQEILVVADLHAVPDRHSKIFFTPGENVFALPLIIVIYAGEHMKLIVSGQDFDCLGHPAGMVHDPVSKRNENHGT